MCIRDRGAIVFGTTTATLGGLTGSRNLAMPVTDLSVGNNNTSPAAYSGQLKAFFDLLPQAALAGKVAGLIATGAVAHHALAIDHALRPLVASLGGLSAAHAIYATEDTYPSGSATLPEPLAAAVADLAAELIRLS